MWLVEVEVVLAVDAGLAVETAFTTVDVDVDAGLAVVLLVVVQDVVVAL